MPTTNKKFRFNWMNIALFILPILLLSSSCKDEEPPYIPPPEEDPKEIIISPGSDAAADAQTAFIEVEAEYTIIFEAGEFFFTNTLSMDGKSNVVVIGAGENETILDFSGQTSGGEGVSVTNSTNIRFENLTVRDAPGDALKARECDYISFVNVATIWSGEPSTSNGAYGLYPVLCSHVYIDDCYAYGASDAGIYVGQSDQIIVKNSTAEGNVAGIEIENSTNADVFDNETFDNTGGILIFDLPGLTMAGNTCRVFNNNVHDNNRINFAPAGNIVANVPIGTGIMILSTKNVEIFGNTLANNNFSGVMVASYLIIDDSPDDPNYDPYPSGIFIHDNNHGAMGEANFVNQTDLIKILILVVQGEGYDLPQVVLDGLLDPQEDVCIQEDASTSFVNLNAWEPDLLAVSDDISAHLCTGSNQPEVNFTPY